jgi:5-methylcytosine-specific restriction endonuclease McrA
VIATVLSNRDLSAMDSMRYSDCMSKQQTGNRPKTDHTPSVAAKTCSKCDEIKPLDDFHKRTRSHDGLMSQCKECVNKRIRDNYRRNPSAKIAATRKYHLSNPEWSKKKLRESHVRNREERYARYKERLNSDPEFREYHRKLTADSERKRRAIKSGADAEHITLDMYEELLNEFEGKCWICGVTPEPVFWDHFHPLAKGGPHTLDNLRPSCNSCNVRKNALWPFTDQMKNRIAAEVRALRISQSTDGSATDGEEVTAYVNRDD